MAAGLLSLLWLKTTASIMVC